MTDVRVRGTSDPAELAAVLAVVLTGSSTTPAPDGLAAWRDRRRRALATSRRP